MKLLSLTNRYYLFSIILIVISGSFVTYAIFKSIINEEQNRKLYTEKDQFAYEFVTFDVLKGSYYLNIGDKIFIKQIENNRVVSETLKDTVIFNDFQQKSIRYRQLKFMVMKDGQAYEISFNKSLLTADKLLAGIGEIMLFVMLGFISSLVVVNSVISKRIWNPFHNTLDFLAGYKISKPQKMHFPPTNIIEFQRLNEVLKDMIEKIQSDYQNLKEFIENVSHEIQTPLSVIMSKAELELQDLELKQESSQNIKTIYEAANRLSKLNQGLAQLTKIEHGQFVERKTLKVKAIIEEKLEFYEDLLAIRNIELITNLDDKASLFINPTLASILITNMLSNAIKHNYENGKIEIVLKRHELKVVNTGIKLTEPTSKFFERFKKGAGAVESTGLGLSLIKRIADIHGFYVTYDNQEEKHLITLKF